MKKIIIWLKHWYQRNFGHVYVRDDKCKWYIFKAKRGKIALNWFTIIGTIGFICKLGDNFKVLNNHNKEMKGYGEQYGSWTWSYDKPMFEECLIGGYW